MSASLKNFPHISQRDGNINSSDDCVGACVGMGLTYLTGKKYTAGQVKDAVYGPGYTGGTAAVEYERYCAEQGVSLTPINGNPSQLVAALKAQISAGHPCIVTEPDPYEAGWSHCCAAYAFNSDAQTITVVDPWIDRDVTRTDASWQSQLLYSQIWTMSKSAPGPPAGRENWVPQQQEDIWNSTGTGSPFNTGIAEAWKEVCTVYGPPLGKEFDTVDGGQPVKAQSFAGGWCAWNRSTGHATWHKWQ